jgi:hypothetical protein
MVDSSMKWHEEYNKSLIDIKNTCSKEQHKNILLYIKLLNNKQEDKIMENKILEIEKDYDQKIKYIESLCNDTNKINLVKSKNSLIILQKELEIIKILTKYTLQNKILDYKFFRDCLILLLNLSETLRYRIKQKEIIHDSIEKNKNINGTSSIYRCSYKFCSYHANCIYNYNKSKNLCYQDHYVHNMVSADIKILLKYIEDKTLDKLTIQHTKEILKTINTLSYVICHMENELKTKCLYLPEKEWESMHVIKNK